MNRSRRPPAPMPVNREISGYGMLLVLILALMAFCGGMCDPLSQGHRRLAASMQSSAKGQAPQACRHLPPPHSRHGRPPALAGAAAPEPAAPPEASAGRTDSGPAHATASR